MKTRIGAAILGLFFLSLIFVPHSAADVNFSTKLSLVWEGYTFDHKTGITSYRLSLRNSSLQTLSGPFKVIIEKNDNPYIVIKNPDGYTPNGKPYYLYEKDKLSPGKKTVPRVWKFEHQCKNISIVIFKELRFFKFLTQLRCSPTAICYLSVFGEVAANHPSVAEAGPDQDVTVGDLVHLDGRTSHDPDGDLITYNWSITAAPSGSTAALDVPTSVIPTFTPDRPGSYTVSLIVSDGKSFSPPDSVEITAALLNVAPTANAGPNQSVITGSIVYLDGSASFDPDGDRLTFEWQMIARPEGSNAFLSGPSSVFPNFLADRDGDYLIRLRVSDGILYSLPDDVIVVSATPNAYPVAFAGNDQTVVKNTMIQLDGSGSSDPNSDPLTFSWTIVSSPTGSTSSFDDAASPTPQILADKSGEYVFRLIVYDGEFYSNEDTVIVVVTNNSPVANAGVDRQGVINVPINLDGGGSSDGDGDTLAYLWSIVSAPIGSTAQILSPTSMNPAFTPDLPGTYVLQLVVNDGTEDSAPDTVTITANLQMVNVPSVVGMAQAAAQTAIGTANLTVGLITTANSNTVPAGSVISQDPIAGTSVAVGSAVSLIVSSGPPPVLVPNVVGIIQAAAQAAILANNLTLGTVTTDNSLTVSAGNVISQDPSAGTLVMGGTPVSLVISLGPSSITVPNVVGLTQTSATSAITSASLVVKTVTYQNSDTVAAGNVISQNPTAGASVSPGSAVDLVISDGQSGPVLPPDPTTVAPPVNPTVATSVAGSTEFLYTGSNPIQTGVASGTINAKRAAVLRGKVLTSEGNPLSGVVIRILNRGEYGQTLSRADGMVDLAVNGGEMLTVQYSKEGFLTAQRQASVPLQDFAFLPDVVLIQKDNRVTSIDLSLAAPMQAAQGNVVTDEAGTRQAALIFPQGTTATAVLSNGSANLPNLSVRITEYSVGPEGPKAMPAKLPPTVGYTYCVEFGVDEADALGATEVRFSQPLFHYVHNFLKFPVGMIVPVAYYDRQKGVWVASDNGRVIKVLAINSGRAELDTDGDNTADNGVALGVTPAERETIASLFNVGDSLWRAPITHFTPWDLNWGVGLPLDSQSPQQPSPVTTEPVDNDCITGGSKIECQNQTLGESLRIAGTPFSMNYSSGRVSGRTAAYTVKIPLSGENIPQSLRRIDLEVLIAGQRHTQNFPAMPNQSTIFTWNGQDAYGRRLQGSQPIHIRVGYVYNGVYQSPVDMANTFGRLSGVPITNTSAREEITLWQEQKPVVGPWDALAQGLGGWTLNVHHAYDPGGSILYGGDGSRRSAQSVGSIITTIAGGGGYESKDGVPATESSLYFPVDVAVKPDGSFYTSDTFSAYASPSRHIRYVDSNGIITTIAGIPGYYDCSLGEGYGDGIQAVDACLYIKSFTMGPDGSLYIASDQRVRRIGPDGIITTVAGVNPLSNQVGFSGDGGLATEAQMYDPQGIAFASDGSLYITDSGNKRIRHVASDGIITTVAGNGQSCSDFCACGDGGPAPNAPLMNPVDVAVGPDGSLYIAEYAAIRKVGLDGIISTTICGTESYSSVLIRSWDEGIPANSAFAGRIRSIKFGPDGSLYFAACDEKYGTGTDTYCFVRRIGTDGIVNTVVGGIQGYSGDGGAPDQARIDIRAGNGGGIDIGADGSIYIADTNNKRIRVVRKSLPGVDVAQVVIPSKDGMVLHKFDANGRHLETIHALTGSLLYQFSYDANGRLMQIVDGNGNITAIERDSQGNPLAMVGPYGQRTALGLDAKGYLASIINPASQSFQFTYTDGGLLTQMSDPKGNVRQYSYDALGYLIRNDAPEGNFQTFTREEIEKGHKVTKRTALDRITTYSFEKLSTGQVRRINTFPDGTQSRNLKNPDGRTVINTPDGMVINYLEGPDPRFNMQSPVFKEVTIQTPGGLRYSLINGRTANLSNPNDALSLITLTETTALNGRTYTNSFNAASRTYTFTTPEGRTNSEIIDSLGRLTQIQSANLYPIRYSYDTRGRLADARLGTGGEERITNFGYNPQGFLDTVTDPLGRITTFQYDNAGRIIKKILPDSNEISLGYDANGNLISISPPGRPVHTFSYTGMDYQAEYVPPIVGSSTQSTGYSYNADGQLIEILRPDSQRLSFLYDAAGRLRELNSTNVRNIITYNSTTGNLQTITDTRGGTLTFGFDGSLMISQNWAGSVSGTVGFVLDNNIRLIEERVNGTSNVSFTYDNDGLLITAGGLNLQRNAQTGFIVGTQIGGVNDTRGYNLFGELGSYSSSYSGSPLHNTQYTYDKAGRIVEKTETIDGAASLYTYSYDPVGRLYEVRKGGAVISRYTYDENGNRLSFTDGVTTLTGIYDSQDRLLQYGNVAYTYSATGELLSKTDSGQTTKYQYDVLGNILSVTFHDSTAIQYVVDGMNRRVGKKVNGTPVKGFLYKDQLNPVAELDGANNIVSRFVYASRANVPDYMIQGGIAYRIIADYLGSPRIVVNSQTGVIAQRMDFDEFGRIILDTNPGFQPFGFAGGLYDQDTGLNRFGARDYDAETGRWTAKDPILFSTEQSNLYGYVMNDPVNLNDVSGLAPQQNISGSVPSGLPITGGTISTVFGPAHLPGKPPIFHPGLTISAQPGTPVHPTGSGIVTEIGCSPTGGNYVVIEHISGYSTIYANLGQINVQVGQTVSSSNTIGSVGQTGTATGPSLYYQVNNSEGPVDPFMIK